MDTVTYPEPRTVEFVTHYLIPVRVNTGSQSPLPARFAIQYTPTQVLLDGDGKEHHRSVGFLPPEEFIASLLLGIGKAYFNHNQFSKALRFFEKLLSEHPRSQSAVTANDLRKVCLNKGAGR
jgi:thioredoxin-related protein